MEQNRIYVCPERARKKLKTAYDIGQTVYIYGMTGYGKTLLARNFLGKKKYLYLDASTALASEFSIPISTTSKKTKQIVVIDNLHYADSQNLRSAITALFGREDLWLILISRAACPAWINSYRIKVASFMEIDQNDLSLNMSELREYLVGYFGTFPEDMMETVLKICEGHGLALNILCEQLAANSTSDDFGILLNKDIVLKMQKIFWDYVECEVFDMWDREVVDFLMKLSIIDSFDKQTADYITGSTKTEHYIDYTFETGNFLIIKDGKYYMEEAARNCLLRRMEKSFTKKQIDELYYNAGRYFRQQGNNFMALKMFEKNNSLTQIAEILAELATEHPGGALLPDLKRYYMMLTEEQIRSNPNLMVGICMLYSMSLNIEKSEYWYKQIEEYERNSSGALKKKYKSSLAYLALGLPHRGSMEAISLIKNMANLADNRSILLQEFCVTGNSPSNMNGGKDFCEWSKKDKELANTIGKALSFVLGKHGAGLVDLALAESFYEKGYNDYEVVRYVSKGLMKAENGGKIEQCFVGAGILSKIHLRNGHMDDAEDVVYSFKKKAESENAYFLYDNIENHICTLKLYKGDRTWYLNWMENNTPDENIEFFTYDRYSFLNKVRIYIIQKKWSLAHTLLERLLYYAEMYERPYIMMESLILLAIVERKAAVGNWKETFQKAYTMAEEYHFVRVISAEASESLKLFQNISLEIKDMAFYNDALKESKKMAELYPEYLKDASAIELPDRALQILRLQAQGLSNEEISQELSVALSTIKYHCRETYQKLGVGSRTAAVVEARKRKLI